MWSKQQVEELVSPIIRKYDWEVSKVDGGIELAVKNATQSVSTVFSGTEDVRAAAQDLIKELDEKE